MPATSGNSATELRNALFMESFLFILYERLSSLQNPYQTSQSIEMTLQNHTGKCESEAVLKNYFQGEASAVLSQ